MKIFIATAVLTLLSVLPSAALAEATPGQPAPSFSVKDASGTVHTLAEYKGKWLVLEWFNKDCPFVHKHYDSGNMQGLQKTYTAKGVNWLSVVSSAKGKQGHLEPEAVVAVAKEKNSSATAIVLDPMGEMGHAYGAKTTPHMFVIDPQGKVVYAGAIDDNDSSDPAVIKSSHNLVSAALDQGLAGQRIAVSSSRPYGCGVKY